MLAALLVLPAAMSVMPGPARAQTTAGVRGTITDPTGLVVPNATVTITDLHTQLDQTTKAGADGICTFFNHANFGNPAATITVPMAGRTLAPAESSNWEGNTLSEAMG